MSKMHNPPHPGETLKEDVLPALGLTVTEAAQQLGVARVTLSRMINGHAAISADMAIRLAQWLGGSAEIWLRLQLQYDLWHAEKNSKIKIKPAQQLAAQRINRRLTDSGKSGNAGKRKALAERIKSRKITDDDQQVLDALPLDALAIMEKTPSGWVVWTDDVMESI